MVPVTALWLPILVAAALVFVVSSLIHMVLGYHNSDYAGVPDEDGLRGAVGPMRIPPGDYMVPYCADAKERGSDAFAAKIEQGPVMVMTVFGNTMDMRASLIQWFVFCLLTGAVAAYATGLAYGPGAEYMQVFRMAAVVAFAGYGWALLQNSIWMKRNWGATGKALFDALIYGCVTAGTLAWLWPG